MAPLKSVGNWLDRPQRTNRDALVVGVIGALLFAALAYAFGRLLDAAHLIDFASSVPVWVASVAAGIALGLGLLLGRRSIRDLHASVGELQSQVIELQAQ